MYTPPSFKIEDRAELFGLMEEFSFATLVTEYEGALIATHLPLLVSDREGQGKLVGHMARANDQWRSFDGTTEALAIFTGPHGYISPSLYVAQPSVPTWNYTVVHAYGAPKIIDEFDGAVDILRRSVEKFEGGRANPWEMDKLPADYIEKMVRAIVAFEIPIRRIEGKAKLSQNRSEEDRARAIEELGHSDREEERRLGNMMRDALVRPKRAVQ